MSAINRKLIFDAAKRRGAVFETLADVQDMDAAIDEAIAGASGAQEMAPARTGRQVSQRGIDLIHSFEQCRLDAYKDPGSSNGLPITIGWGSTSDLSGNPIRLGTRWTQRQCDERFAADIAKYAAEVSAALGNAPTDQSQFDALVSFHYNTGKIRTATLTKKHKSGDYAGAAAGFGKWIFNDGKPMKGLIRRRAAEAALYMADG